MLERLGFNGTQRALAMSAPSLATAWQSPEFSERGTADREADASDIGPRRSWLRAMDFGKRIAV